MRTFFGAASMPVERQVEDTDLVFRYQSVRRGHVGAESRATPRRYRRALRACASRAGRTARRGSDRCPGDFAVRAERVNPESVRWEHELVRFLAEEIDEVVAPLPALDGSTFYLGGSRRVSVFPFVEGDQLRSREGVFRHSARTCGDPLFITRARGTVRVEPRWIVHRCCTVWRTAQLRRTLVSCRRAQLS